MSAREVHRMSFKLLVFSFQSGRTEVWDAVECVPAVWAGTPPAIRTITLGRDAFHSVPI